MKKGFLGFVFVTILAMSTVVLYAQQNVAGLWTISVQGMSLQLVLAQDGQKVSGTLESPHGNIPITGEFSQGKLALSGAPTEEHPIRIAGTATLTAEGALVGTLSANQTEMSFTAVRAAGK